MIEDPNRTIPKALWIASKDPAARKELIAFSEALVAKYAKVGGRQRVARVTWDTRDGDYCYSTGICPGLDDTEAGGSQSGGC